MTRNQVKAQLQREADLYHIRKAYVDGAEIQFLSITGDWVDLSDADFSNTIDKYRIKPVKPTKYMTPLEVMCYCDCLTRSLPYKHLFVKLKSEKIIYKCFIINSNSVIENYEYTFFDDKGKQVSDWKEFEKNEDNF